MPCICDPRPIGVSGVADASLFGTCYDGMQPLPQILLRSGEFILSRTPNGQLWLSDGVRGTAVDEAKFQKILTNIMEHRWQF